MLKMQTTTASLHGKPFNLGGNTISVSLDGHIELEGEVSKKDRDTLAAMGFGNKTGRAIAPGKPSMLVGLAGAKEFIRVLKADEALEEEAKKVSSFKEFLGLARARGFLFTQPQYDDAKAASKSEVGPNNELVALRGEMLSAKGEVVTPFGTYMESDLAAVAGDRGMTTQEAFCVLFGLAPTPAMRSANVKLSLKDMLAGIDTNRQQEIAPPVTPTTPEKPVVEATVEAPKPQATPPKKKQAAKKKAPTKKAVTKKADQKV